MKFTKFGKALLMSALSVGVILGITSCVQSYSVGYLYVTGTVTAQTTGNGIISGFKIDHNTGKLITHQRAADFFRRRQSRPRRSADRRALYLCVEPGRQWRRGRDLHHRRPMPELQHYPVLDRRQRHSYRPGDVLYPGHQSVPHRCRQLGQLHLRAGSRFTGAQRRSVQRCKPEPELCTGSGTGVTTCGDITAFKIDPTTGRLTLVVNSQVTSASGAALPYFPVPSDPIDFVLGIGLHPHTERNTDRRGFGLPVHL